MVFRSDRKSTRLNSSHTIISYAVFCLKKKKKDSQLDGCCRVTSARQDPWCRTRNTQRIHPTHTITIYSTKCISLYTVFFFFFFFFKTNPPPPHTPPPPPPPPF